MAIPLTPFSPRSRCSLPGSKQLYRPRIPRHRSFFQPLMIGSLQSGIGGDERAGEVPCLREQIRVVREAGVTDFEPARLPRADQVAHPPLLQIQLGNPEPVLRSREGVEPVRRGAIGQEDAVALLRPAADAAAELVKLGEAQAL